MAMLYRTVGPKSRTALSFSELYLQTEDMEDEIDSNSIRVSWSSQRLSADDIHGVVGPAVAYGSVSAEEPSGIKELTDGIQVIIMYLLQQRNKRNVSNDPFFQFARCRTHHLHS